MAIKYFEVEDIGTVRISKRSGSRNVRLSITAGGEIRVTIPQWSPYQNGVDFVRSKTSWILRNIPEKEAPLQHGQRIGKAHRLAFVTATVDAPSSRLLGTEIRVTRPQGMAATHPLVQKSAQKAGIRALRSQAEALLPRRLQQLATQYGFSYGSVSVKQLKGRWGSCDNKQDIVLNLFLMQLPWHLIDYVLVHELVHTKHLNHSPEFWREFMRHEPRAKQLRAVIRTHKPILTPVIPT
jgi:predicted metal-dependent hydrolase